MKSLARGLVLKQWHKVTRKWPILLTHQSHFKQERGQNGFDRISYKIYKCNTLDHDTLNK